MEKQVKFCVNCGERLGIDAQSCHKCGVPAQPVQRTEVEVVVSAAQKPESEATAAFAQKTDEAAAPLQRDGYVPASASEQQKTAASEKPVQKPGSEVAKELFFASSAVLGVIALTVWLTNIFAGGLFVAWEFWLTFVFLLFVSVGGLISGIVSKNKIGFYLNVAAVTMTVVMFFIRVIN